jgi:hypothetical protein
MKQNYKHTAAWIIVWIMLATMVSGFSLIELMATYKNSLCSGPNDLGCASKYGGLVLADDNGDYTANSPTYACTPFILGQMTDGICIEDFEVNCAEGSIDWDCHAWVDACSSGLPPTAQLTTPSNSPITISIGDTINVEGTGSDRDGSITGFRTDVYHLTGGRVQKSEGVLDYTLNTHPGSLARTDSRFFDKHAKLKFLKTGDYLIAFQVKDNTECWSDSESVVVHVVNKTLQLQAGEECTESSQCGTVMYCSYGEDDEQQPGEQGQCCPNGQYWASNLRGDGGSCLQASVEQCGCDKSVAEVLDMAKHLQNHPEKLPVEVRNRPEYVTAVSSAVQGFTNFLRSVGIIPNQRPEKIKPFFYDDFAYGNPDINEQCINPQTRQVCLEGTITQFNQQYMGKFWQNYTVY